MAGEKTDDGGWAPGRSAGRIVRVSVWVPPEAGPEIRVQPQVAGHLLIWVTSENPSRSRPGGLSLERQVAAKGTLAGWLARLERDSGS